MESSVKGTVFLSARAAFVARRYEICQMARAATFQALEMRRKGGVLTRGSLRNAIE